MKLDIRRFLRRRRFPERAVVPEIVEHPLARRAGWHLTDKGWSFEHTESGVSANYKTIDRAAATRAGNQAWHFADVARKQHDAYMRLISEIDHGRVRIDFAVAAEAVRKTGLPTMSLIEIGCASGYYSRVFAKLAPGFVRYTGVDFSASMIGIAKAMFGDAQFEIADARCLPFPDASFDVAMNGVSIMHIAEYEHVIHETRRVAQRFCLFHTTIVMDRKTLFLEKSAYGRAAVEVILDEAEFLGLAEQEGLRLVQRWDSIPYDLRQEIGTPTHSRSYLFEIVGPSLVKLDRFQPLCASSSIATAAGGPMLNLGCGSHYHPGWVNLDMASRGPDVIEHNLLERLPFVDETFDVVYHSHVLEHLPKRKAPEFLRECYRVMAPGGLIRVAIPDLEQICRLYVELLDGALAGDGEAVRRYDWVVIELLDQMARERSGGEMREYWRQDPMPAGDFVIERVGQEAKSAIAHIQAVVNPPDVAEVPQTVEELGTFRRSGEVHQWMYDRFSLGRLLMHAGFCDPIVRQAKQSELEGFERFGLDSMPDGSVRKPDSLFVEARRPDSTATS